MTNGRLIATPERQYMPPSEIANDDMIEIYDVSQGVTKSMSFDDLCVAIANNSNVGGAKK